MKDGLQTWQSFFPRTAEGGAKPAVGYFRNHFYLDVLGIGKFSEWTIVTFIF